MTTIPKPGITEYSTPSDVEVAVIRLINARRPLAWDLWTNPKHIQKWLLGPDGWTMPVCEVDLKPGGAWKMTWRKDGGTEMTMTGEYLEVDPPRRVVSTERWGPDWPVTVNTVEFTESGERTILTLTMKYPSKDARDKALATGMKGGMDVSFARLDTLVGSLA